MPNLSFDYKLGRWYLYSQEGGEFLFTDNDTNTERLYGISSLSKYTKDAFHRKIVNGEDSTNPKLTGTKEGCREGDCGACTILVGTLKGGAVQYRAVNSCLLPLGDVNGSHIVTIEGLRQSGSMTQQMLTPVQSVMAECGGTQCGFCTPGFIMSMTGYLLSTLHPDEKSMLA
ncbi:MAG: hypothetical protein HUU45_11535, partial [Leptospiraceae bacterium]|nr:hypothetical protein [Leptospiraceae bacterium]